MSTDKVEYNPDGSVTLRDEPGGGVGDWTVYEDSDDVWVARNPAQGFLRSPINADFRAEFGTRGEALAVFGIADR